MTDPRNIAHDKKVASDKAAHGEEIAPGADETPQPGGKPHWSITQRTTPGRAPTRSAPTTAPDPGGSL